MIAVLCPLPLWERAAPNVQQARLGEGLLLHPSPNPFRCATVQPSPTRGEGTIFGTELSDAVVLAGGHPDIERQKQNLNWWRHRLVSEKAETYP